jgi:hypothetical protein
MIEIGTSKGRKVVLTDQERARHIHVIGSIGTGKSKLLEHMIRQDVARGRGLCLIDPHGTLAESIEKWCAMRGIGFFRKVHLVNPGDEVLVPGFNPLRVVPGEDPSVRVDAMVAACAQAWGVENMGETPRLEKILRALFYALAVRNLTLAEGPALLQSRDPEGLRALLTDGLPNPIFQITWNELNAMPRREFAEHVESTHTRLSRFLNAPAMRLVVGQRKKVIDFRSAMDNGEVVLVNLGARSAFSYENARVLGTLLINDLFLTALRRDEKVAQRRPFTLYVDECYDFLSGDIERILDQTRKFGLHAVLAHQRIGQLRERGEGVFNAVMGGTQTKIVLGGLSDEDAEVMAKEIMRGDIDLEKPKTGLDVPMVVGEEPFWLESESGTEAISESRAQTFSRSASAGSATNQSLAQQLTVDNFALVQTNPTSQVISAGGSEQATTTRGYSESEGSSTSRSRTWGRSQVLKPVREWRHTAYYSLEECFHLAMLKIRNLKDQTAIVKRRGQRTVVVKTIPVRPVLSVPRIGERFRARAATRSGFVVSAGVAREEVDGRLSAVAFRPAPPDETFWHEE